MTAGKTPAEIEQRLVAIRGGAHRRSPNVRALAAYAAHADCNLATLGFSARVDFDRLLDRTKYEAPFGQSPFAFQRGVAFERLIQDHGYAATLELLRSQMNFAIEDARIINLRDAYPKNADGMRLRATETRRLVRQVVSGDPTAPNLVDGAVLQTTVGGIPARFEADALAARFGGLIHAGEIKSFPVVDGRAEQDKAGSAFDQVAIYILLAKQLVDEVGGDSDLVSTIALLITPMNVGLKPTLSKHDVSKRIDRIQRLLSAVPDVSDIARAVPRDVTFGAVADLKAPEQQRIDALHDLAERIGTTYSPSCLSTCGNAIFCRERAFGTGQPCIVGPEAVRLLPGVRTLERAAELTEGAPPSRDEAAVAPHLARAGRLYDAATRRLRVMNASGARP